MSRSYRTEKVSRLAARRIKRDSAGEPVHPRIVERRPAIGDDHPIPRSILRRMLARVPVEYLYGLRSIELRARRGTVGQPFAVYRPRDRTIILYSLPPVWEVSPLPPSFRRSLKRFFATIEDSPGKWTSRVSWSEPWLLAVWFFIEVFAHELGHHFRFQYRNKNGNFGRRRDEELVAELHSARFLNSMLRRVRSKRAGNSVSPEASEPRSGA